MAINRLDGQGLPPELTKAGQKSTSGSSGGAEATAREGDKVELSRAAKQIANLRQSVADLPDVREDRVAKLRDALSRGTYQVESRDLARALLRDADDAVRD